MRSKNKELTKTERAVYNELVQGKKNKEIGTSLFIAESTVKAHVTSIFKKLRVNSRFELVVKHHIPNLEITKKEPERDSSLPIGNKVEQTVASTEPTN